MNEELNNETQQFEQVVAPESQEPTPAPQEDNKTINFRIMRDRAEAAERRAMELERMVQMNLSQNQQSTKLQLEEEDDFDVNDDSYVEGKQLKKYVKSLKKELSTTKKQFEEFNQQSKMNQAELMLKSQFNDFESVVTKENLEKLAMTKAPAYRSIMAAQDIYDRGYLAYELIKSSGLSEKNYEAQDKRIEENKSKPRSASNAPAQTSETPMARMGDYDRRVLTEDRKNQLLQQVAAAKAMRQ